MSAFLRRSLECFLDTGAKRSRIPRFPTKTRELVDQSEGDFDQVADRLLKKNRELYERLR